jgi:hypothetical protein
MRYWGAGTNQQQFTEEYDGIIQEGYLCLYGVRFIQVTRITKFNGVNNNSIWDSIEAQGALKRNNKGRRQTQINCSKKTPHFYKIPLTKLD